jgi:hypothetical protein
MATPLGSETVRAHFCEPKAQMRRSFSQTPNFQSTRFRPICGRRCASPSASMCVREADYRPIGRELGRTSANQAECKSCSAGALDDHDGGDDLRDEQERADGRRNHPGIESAGGLPATSGRIAVRATAWENPAVQVYALTSTGVSDETLDLFVAREAAESTLREILQHEPGWKDTLRRADRTRWARVLRRTRVSVALALTLDRRCHVHLWTVPSTRARPLLRPAAVPRRSVSRPR